MRKKWGCCRAARFRPRVSDSNSKSLVVTDSIARPTKSESAQNIRRYPIAPLLGEAHRHRHLERKSVSSNVSIVR
jgi:phosphoribosylpyrophosphate synthetase